MGNFISFLIDIILLAMFIHMAAAAAAPPSFKQTSFSFIGFDEGRDIQHFYFPGKDSSIDGGALQLTPDTINDEFGIKNKSGRIMYRQPFKLWVSDLDDDDIVSSFTSFFVINIYSEEGWNAGHGFAFLIAPDQSLPSWSYGQWLGLTNATTDGNSYNQIVAIEFDTEMQAELGDPDDNHVGLNINSVRSNKTVSLYDFGIEISSQPPTNWSVWIEYNGSSKLLQVYMAKHKDPKPGRPILSENINLKRYVKQESFFGFAGSTGDQAIQLNCVLQWNLTVEVLPHKKDLTWLKIGASVGIPVLILFIVICGGLVLHLKKKRRSSASKEPNVLGTYLKRLPGMPREFKYKDLKKATNDFHESMKLGQGGFGIVYKGVVHDKDFHDKTTEIAVKKFSRDNIKSKDDFLAELAIIHRLRHKHLVRLLGWCYEKGKLLLVYEFMPNCSLEKHLYEASNQHTLNWVSRCKILTGIASALHYLHNEFDQKVVHRDLKTSNILLDLDFNARLGDFGLARALDNERNSYAELGLEGVPGTMGYVAPECFQTGRATPESDVFGFGAVVLEVVSGKSPGTKIHHHQQFHTLVDWVWMLHREGRIQDAVDERLTGDYADDEAKRLLLLGLACSHPIASERPQTQALFQIVTGTLPVPHVPPFKPVFPWPSEANSNTDSTLSITLSSQYYSCSRT